MIKILILSCGTNASYHFCKRFREQLKDEVYIIGTDTNEQWLVPSTQYLDKFYKVPPSKDTSFLNFVETILSNETPNYILPSFDFDQMNFYTGSPILAKYNVISLSTPKETLDIYSNKLKMNYFLKNNGFHIPIQYAPNQLNPEEKYFIKPTNGVGSIGTGVKTGAEILQLNTENLIIQEICNKPEITLECFCYKNVFSCVCRERLATKAGVCTKTRVFHNKHLADIGLKFCKSLHTPVYFNLQFMMNFKGDYVITDVNLRSAGGMSLSYVAGWDVVGAIVAILTGNEEKIPSYIPYNIPEQFVVRAYQDIVTKVCPPILAFDLDGTLVDSRPRHRVLLDMILKKYNCSIDTTDLIPFKANGKNNIDFLVTKGISSELAKKIQSEWIEHIEDVEFLHLDTLYPETIGKLSSLVKNNNLILVTARKNKNNLLKELDDLALKPFFQNIYMVYGTNIAHRKAEILINSGATCF